MCAPHLGEDDFANVDPDTIPAEWSNHFETAIEHLNGRILPSFQFSPKELLLGLVINTPRTPSSATSNEATPDDVNVHSAYVAQQRLDALSNSVVHAIKRKATFDKRVLGTTAGEVVFTPGQLVQVHASELTNTFQTSRKILPQWSAPRRVVSRRTNSYSLETLEGFPMAGWYHARRLRLFLPRTGTLLAEAESKREHQEEESSSEEP